MISIFSQPNFLANDKSQLLPGLILPSHLLLQLFTFFFSFIVHVFLFFLPFLRALMLFLFVLRTSFPFFVVFENVCYIFSQLLWLQANDGLWITVRIVRQIFWLLLSLSLSLSLPLPLWSLWFWYVSWVSEVVHPFIVVVVVVVLSSVCSLALFFTKLTSPLIACYIFSSSYISTVRASQFDHVQGVFSSLFESECWVGNPQHTNKTNF